MAEAMTLNEIMGGMTGGEEGGYAIGGLVRYFGKGGFTPRGTDTIPAMLTPGEFVMNSRATRRFYSQLVAMNAGLSPAYRASGGSVMNAGITGDVTINVSGGQTGQDTARTIVRALNREIRRGTSALRQ